MDEQKHYPRARHRHSQYIGPHLASVAYLYNSYFKPQNAFIPRHELIIIIIDLRKNMFSTLREIAYAANYVRITETALEPRKIKDVLMRDGGTSFINLACAELKLNAIQDMVMLRHNTTSTPYLNQLLLSSNPATTTPTTISRSKYSCRPSKMMCSWLWMAPSRPTTALFQE